MRPEQVCDILYGKLFRPLLCSTFCIVRRLLLISEKWFEVYFGGRVISYR